MSSAVPTNFADRLDAAIEAKGSCLVVGLDPDLGRLPADLLRAVRSSPGDPGFTAHASIAIASFLRDVIDQVADFAVAVKPNTAFFERFGPVGWETLCRVSEHASRAGLLVIADAKRGDIGHTAAAYADSLLRPIPDTVGASADAVTVQPWTGSDGILPFVERARDHGKGIFVLVRTSNPSAAELQDLDVGGGERLYERVARLVGTWGEGLDGKRGLNPIGAVVGATAPREGEVIRAILPRAFFLVPGFGAQGAGADELAPLFAPGGRGVVVNASRSVLYAYQGSGAPWPEAVRAAAREARDALEAVRERAGESPGSRG